MQTTIPTPGTVSWGRRLMPAAALGLLLVFGFAQPGLAQSNPLTLFKNYFVTGDYVVGGWVKGGSLHGTLEKGTINIPDTVQGQAAAVPPGADIVAAFLYWETVESTNPGATTGQHGSFNGYAITGLFLPNKASNSPTSWSSGGCSGSSNGSKTIQGYRADVRPFLPVDSNGKIQTPNAVTPGTYQVELADTGTNGAKVPFTLGATLVIIYRVQSPLVPLNSIVLYDGIFAPSNTSSSAEMSQQIVGFYQAAVSTAPVAKLTHIVGAGQANKSEQVLFNGTALNPLGTAAFTGAYNGSWDNPTFNVSSPLVPSGDVNPVNTNVIPGATNSSCVDWGAVVFSTTVEDTNHDGMLAAWKNATPPGYTDVISVQNGISNPFVALPGASPNAQDIFVEIDYLTLRDANGTILHSHLPKQLALDMVGDAFWKQNIHAHFDVGTNFNILCKLTPTLPGQGTGCPDPYIIQGGTGGNEIPEGAVVCNDTPTTPCQFPGQAAVGWKEGFLFVKDNATVPNSSPPVPLGNFQSGRKDSYHYVFFGHALGTPRSFWTASAATLQSTSVAKLISIVNSGTTATVTIQTPQGLVKPGDCNPANLPPACSDANGDRVTVSGAHGQPALNGIYTPFTIQSQSTDPNTKVTTTTFTITTAKTTTTCMSPPCVADGTYNFSNESRLSVVYGGPTSSSGHSDVGGGDSEVTFGLWLVDDVSGCQADPSVPSQTYCVNQVGTITAEAGTLLHEMGHTFFLTHGGTFFPNGAVSSGPLAGQQTNNPLGVPSFGLNCNPAFLSSMNYLNQIRGFADNGGIDYSGQTLLPLSEIALNETLGIGSDLFAIPIQPATHFTRWYAPPNALDIQLQNTTGGRFATIHCDGTPILDGAQMVRVDGSTFSAPIDWNNDLDPVPDPNPENPVPWQDVNFNGSTFSSPDPPPSPAFNDMQGFNDWINVDLRQASSRANGFGFSSGGGYPPDLTGGGGFPPDLAGGGGFPPDTTGGGGFPPDTTGGGGFPPDTTGGGNEQDQETACSTADPPTGLIAAVSSKSVVLNWTAPGPPCQVRRYDVWRATGSFPALASVLAAVAANPQLFTDITAPKGITGTPPVTTFTDPNVKNNVTYTYFVTETNKQGAQSHPSDPKPILVKF